MRAPAPDDPFEATLIRGPGAACLRGERLCLGPWLDADREPFAAINADPQTMRYFPSTLTRAQSDQVAEGLAEALERRGWGFWAARLHDGEFIGFIGLNLPRLRAPFMPAIETGWRLARGHWGRGLATEGARLALGYAFQSLGLPSIVAFTAQDNQPSRRVMDRLGMHHDPADDFDHPALAPGHPLRRHVLYRLRSDEFKPPIHRQH